MCDRQQEVLGCGHGILKVNLVVGNFVKGNFVDMGKFDKLKDYFRALHPNESLAKRFVADHMSKKLGFDFINKSFT